MLIPYRRSHGSHGSDGGYLQDPRHDFPLSLSDVRESGWCVVSVITIIPPVFTGVKVKFQRDMKGCDLVAYEGDT